MSPYPTPITWQTPVVHSSTAKDRQELTFLMKSALGTCLCTKNHRMAHHYIHVWQIVLYVYNHLGLEFDLTTEATQWKALLRCGYPLRCSSHQLHFHVAS